MYNMCTEEDGGSGGGGERSAAAHSLENSITMSKMKLLKAKMEDMNINKKVQAKSVFKFLPGTCDGLRMTSPLLGETTNRATPVCSCDIRKLSQD